MLSGTPLFVPFLEAGIIISKNTAVTAAISAVPKHTLCVIWHRAEGLRSCRCYALSLCLDPRNRQAFHLKYTKMIANGVSLLKDGHAACIVIGNIREKQGGALLDLHSDTKLALSRAGCVLHEDAILTTALFSAPKIASSAVLGAKFVSPRDPHTRLSICLTPLLAFIGSRPPASCCGLQGPSTERSTRALILY